MCFNCAILGRPISCKLVVLYGVQILHGRQYDLLHDLYREKGVLSGKAMSCHLTIPKMYWSGRYRTSLHGYDLNGICSKSASINYWMRNHSVVKENIICLTIHCLSFLSPLKPHSTPAAL